MYVIQWFPVFIRKNLSNPNTMDKKPIINELPNKVSYKSLLCESITDGSVTLIKPREYQKSLIDFAKNQNTIIFLGTGLGKTLVAIYAIKDLFNELPSVNKVSEKQTIKGKNLNTSKVNW